MSLSQFRSAHLPLASIHNFGLEVPPGNAISEGRPPLCITSLEPGALDTGGTYIENDSDQKFSKTKFFKVFLKTTFFHDSCHPDHYEPEIFFRFSKSGSTLRYTILDSRVPPCNAISEGRLPLCNTSSEAGALDTGGTYRE